MSPEGEPGRRLIAVSNGNGAGTTSRGCQRMFIFVAFLSRSHFSVTLLASLLFYASSTPWVHGNRPGPLAYTLSGDVNG